MKKAISAVLVLTMLLSLGTLAFAAETPKLEGFDNSTIGDTTRLYAGEEDEVYLYPIPRDAAFDIFSADITCSNSKVLGVRPDKRETYEYGFVVLTGKTAGSAVVTVTDPASGASCRFKVTVLPHFLSVLENALAFLLSLPGRLAGSVMSLFG